MLFRTLSDNYRVLCGMLFNFASEQHGLIFCGLSTLVKQLESAIGNGDVSTLTTMPLNLNQLAEQCFRENKCGEATTLVRIACIIQALLGTTPPAQPQVVEASLMS